MPKNGIVLEKGSSVIELFPSEPKSKWNVWVIDEMLFFLLLNF